jgi:DUF2934 family protein
MTEPESMTQVREEGTRGKGGKGKTTIKRPKTETPPRQEAPVESRQSQDAPKAPAAFSGGASRDLQTIAKIQERAYRLFEERGREHGHELEHWLEAERDITGSSDRCDR